ncbi:DUF4421 domain-containing protein [Prevotella jejuni]|uniref:DUF4421 domain-containing protein n=1 Tax=Prevotella jejuni TaxID=1177574 RepID=UPI0028E481E4|nr:DUF4421 domain-containing protein [Prevotella jejuni]
MKLTINDYLFLCLLLLLLGGTKTYALSFTVIPDSIVVGKDSGEILPMKLSTDSVRWMRREEPSVLLKHKAAKGGSFLQRFNEIDTSYIEPQKYNFAFMIQNTNTYEVYRLSSSSEQSITFAPEATVRIGPYFGWRWIFLGYTLDIKHLDFWHRNNNPRQEYDLSLYSSMLGLDIYYRKTGNDYKIRQLYLGKNIDTEPIRGTNFGGLTSTIKGFNLYYIFNHRRFSYPAAFSQSTIQRRSAGSPLLGIGYTQHTLTVDWNKLNDVIKERLGNRVSSSPIDSTLMFSEVKYTDVSVSGGYAYNWVFARNWVLAGSVSLALAYKRSSGDVTHRSFSISDFKFNNINIDGIGRFGVVWNNSRWYAGMSTILHAYNYRRSNFSTNNFFGSINVYAGFNFGRKKGT